MEKKSVMKKITGSREALLAVVLIVLFVIITAINPSFLTPKSLMDMLMQMSQSKRWSARKSPKSRLPFMT